MDFADKLDMMDDDRDIEGFGAPSQPPMKQNLTELKREVMEDFDVWHHELRDEVKQFCPMCGMFPNKMRTYLLSALDRVALAALDAVEVGEAFTTEARPLHDAGDANDDTVNGITVGWNNAIDAMLAKRKEFLQV